MRPTWKHRFINDELVCLRVVSKQAGRRTDEQFALPHEGPQSPFARESFLLIVDRNVNEALIQQWKFGCTYL